MIIFLFRLLQRKIIKNGNGILSMIVRVFSFILPSTNLSINLSIYLVIYLNHIIIVVLSLLLSVIESFGNNPALAVYAWSRTKFIKRILSFLRPTKSTGFSRMQWNAVSIDEQTSS